jgi:hypothetical protein
MAIPDDQAGSAAADLAAQRVREIVAAAEQAAIAIVADAEPEARRIRGVAEAEAEEIRAAARTESERTVDAANREASGRIEQARGAVEGLISQADRLRSQVGALGRDLASSVPGGPARVGESAVEDPAADDPATDEAGETEAAVAPGTPEPAATDRAPATDETASAPPSDEELIAQLRGGDREPPATAEALGASSSDHGGARLVAMNMALEGASRDEIATQIEADFGPVAGVEALLDDVLERAKR